MMFTYSRAFAALLVQQIYSTLLLLYKPYVCLVKGKKKHSKNHFQAIFCSIKRISKRLKFYDLVYNLATYYHYNQNVLI